MLNFFQQTSGIPSVTCYGSAGKNITSVGLPNIFTSLSLQQQNYLHMDFIADSLILVKYNAIQSNISYCLVDVSGNGTVLWTKYNLFSGENNYTESGDMIIYQFMESNIFWFFNPYRNDTDKLIYSYTLDINSTRTTPIWHISFGSLLKNLTKEDISNYAWISPVVYLLFGSDPILLTGFYNIEDPNTQYIIALDCITGQYLWYYYLYDNTYVLSIAAGPDNTIYVTTQRLYKLQMTKTTCQVEWSYSEQALSPTAVDMNGNVYLCENYNITGLDAEKNIIYNPYTTIDYQCDGGPRLLNGNLLIKGFETIYCYGLGPAPPPPFNPVDPPLPGFPPLTLTGQNILISVCCCVYGILLFSAIAAAIYYKSRQKTGGYSQLK